MKDEITEHIQFIAYLIQFRNKGIEFKFNDTVSLGEVAMRFENEEREPEKVKMFYKKLWALNKDLHVNEISFITSQIAFLENTFSEGLKKRYWFKFNPLIDYLKHSLELGGLQTEPVHKTFPSDPKHSKNPSKLESVYNVLKPNFIDCTLPEFRKIFSGNNITAEQKINWLGSETSLNYFLKGIFNPEVKWSIATNCFNVNGETIAARKLQDAKTLPKKPDKDKIDKAITHFLPPDKK